MRASGFSGGVASPSMGAVLSCFPAFHPLLSSWATAELSTAGHLVSWGYLSPTSGLPPETPRAHSVELGESPT